MTFFNTIKTALLGLAANKLRSGLTTLGIIIGVASVIVMLALGNGAKAAVEESFKFLGADTVAINRKQAFEDNEYQAVGEILSYADGLQMANDVELVKRVEMNVGGSGKIRYGRNVLDMSIAGVTADILEILVLNGDVQPLGWPTDTPLNQDAFLAAGRFFTPAEVLAEADVCVLGSETAIELFEGDNPIGETVWVNRQRCLVVGVMSELEATNPDEKYSLSPNDAFYMPVSTAIRMLFDEQPSVYITARISDQGRMDEAKAQIAAYLRERHNVEKDAQGNYQDDFDLTTLQDVLGAEQEAAQTFSLLLVAMATISLIVGGIGIMNVMLVSVTERTREIGVRMAVGARARDVIGQFLLEAVILSAVGGVVGIAVGIIVIPLAPRFDEVMAVLDPGSIPLAFGIALLVGVVFGLYPAARAARLAPVEALRYE
jgi:ABC-type antimicrobial peptide transport system permease subunit